MVPRVILLRLVPEARAGDAPTMQRRGGEEGNRRLPACARRRRLHQPGSPVLAQAEEITHAEADDRAGNRL